MPTVNVFSDLGTTLIFLIENTHPVEQIAVEQTSFPCQKKAEHKRNMHTMSKARRSSFCGKSEDRLMASATDTDRLIVQLMASLPINKQGYKIALNAHESLRILKTWIEASRTRGPLG